MPLCLTTPFTQERLWEADGIPVLRADISLPRPEGKDKAARRIRKFYELQARAFLRYCEAFLLPQARAELQEALAASRPFQPWEASLTHRVTYQEGSLLSLYTQSREPGPLLIRRGDTWDLAEAAPVPLNRLFRRRGAWRRLFWETARSELERRERAGVVRLREDWCRQLRRSLNPRNYYLTEEGLAFFLPMYSVGGPQMGVPTFTIPWNEAGGQAHRLPPRRGSSLPDRENT